MTYIEGKRKPKRSQIYKRRRCRHVQYSCSKHVLYVELRYGYPDSINFHLYLQ